MIIQIKINDYKGVSLGLQPDIIITNPKEIIKKIKNLCFFRGDVAKYWCNHMARSPVHFAEGIRMFLPLLYPGKDILYADADIHIRKIKLSGYKKPAFARMHGNIGGYTTALFLCPRGAGHFFEFFIRDAIKYRCYYIEELINKIYIRRKITPLIADYNHK